MEIKAAKNASVARPAFLPLTLPPSQSAGPTDKVDLSATPRKDEKLWRELFSGEIFEIGLKLRPDQIQNTISAAKDLGTGLKDLWGDLRKKVTEILHLPQVEQVIDPADREHATDIILTVAKTLGYTAAGVQGLGGIYKLINGHKKGNTGQKLEGLLDVTTAGAVATTIAGLGVVPLIMGPVAATMGVIRGGYNAVAGFKRGDSRQEIQGFLDTTRSASVGLRLVGQSAGVAGLSVAGKVLAPIAGAIQLSRGYYDLSSGLAEKNKSKQVQGLTDIATAVGLTASLTGVGTIPGIALMAVAMGSRVLYQFSDRFESWANKKLDKWAPGLTRATDAVDRWTDPVINKVRPIFEGITGWHRGQDKDRPAYGGGIENTAMASSAASPEKTAPDGKSTAGQAFQHS